MSLSEVEFNLRVQNILEHINTATDELWEADFSNFPKDHKLKKVLKASLVFEVQKQIQTELMGEVIQG